MSDQSSVNYNNNIIIINLQFLLFLLIRTRPHTYNMNEEDQVPHMSFKTKYPLGKDKTIKAYFNY